MRQPAFLVAELQKFRGRSNPRDFVNPVTRYCSQKIHPEFFAEDSS
jgi:hypothetical protein